MGHTPTIEFSFVSVFVLLVKDDLFVVEPSIVVAQICLVEGLGLVVSLSVGSSQLVSVLVPLGAPSGAIPVLTVHGVTRAQLLERVLLEVVILERGPCRVAVLGDILRESEVLRLVEFEVRVTVTEVRVVVDLRLIEACAGRSLLVIGGVVAGVGEVPCLRAEAA